jgi:outer membrane protein TolC
LAEDLTDFSTREAALLAALNGARGVPPANPVVTPVESDVGTLPGDAASRAASIERHPAAAALRTRADTARAGAARARIEARPEPTAWIGYRVRVAQVGGADPGTNFVSAGVSVPLPFASTRRYAADALAHEELARAAEAAADGTARRLAASLAGAEARYARSVERASAHRERLLPGARAALDSTLAAYQVDRAQFADLIRAEIALVEVERQLLLATTAAAAARAEILTLVNADAVPDPPEASP